MGMARVVIDGWAIYSDIECVKTLDGWEPDGPTEFEFELGIDDIDFDDKDIEELIEKNLDKVIDYLVKKHADRVAKRIEEVKAGGGS